MIGALKILRIEVDGHFHGSSDVPKPWVAQITGIDPKYGLSRTFVDPLRDYAGAKRSWAGRLNGVVACFPLRDGNLYEVSRLRGRTSKRYVAREFLVVEDGELRQIELVEALAVVEPYAGPTLAHTVPDGTTISRVDVIGTPAVCGFVLTGPERDERLYRLRVGSIHEIANDSGRYLVMAGIRHVERLTHHEALARLSSMTTETSA